MAAHEAQLLQEMEDRHTRIAAFRSLAADPEAESALEAQERLAVAFDSDDDSGEAADHPHHAGSSSRPRRSRPSRRKGAEAPSDEQEDAGSSEPPSKRRKVDDIRFQNYVPNDSDLKAQQTGPAAADEFDIDLDELIKEAREEPTAADKLNVAPKKPHWDLKRSLEDSFAILKARTKTILHAIAKEEQAKLAAEQDDSSDDESGSGSDSGSEDEGDESSGDER